MAKDFELVFVSGKGFQSRSLPAPPPLGNTEILVRPKYVGICGSDSYLIESLKGKKGELRLGHEWVGVVELAGRGARLRPGNTVTSTGTLACSNCGYCQNDETHFCDSASYLSSDNLGALRSWMVIREENLVRIPGRLSQSKVLHEVVAVAEEGLRLARNQFKRLPKDVLILGGGPIGTILALVAKASGLRPVVVEKREHRVAIIKKLGLTCVTLGQALLDPGYHARFQFVVDATNDGHGDTGGFRHLPVFGKKGFVGLVIGKYLKPQEIPQVFNRLGAKLVWMRGMPQSTLKASVRKWNTRIEKLSRGYIREVLPKEKVARAFALAAGKKSGMKVVVQL